MSGAARQLYLVFNVGSSSVKYARFLAEAGDEPVLRDRRQADRDAGLGGTAEVSQADQHLIATILTEAETAEGRPVAAIGHRIVHGGRRFEASVVIEGDVLAAMAKLGHLAPLHQPHNLMAVRALAALRPGLPQIACFDTAFHRTQNEATRRLPLPDSFFEEGLERYGFHGLSYAWVVEALTRRLGACPKRLLAFHLGNGASATAILEGRSVATSMGFSTLDGLMMGTRPGGLDPGVLLHLMSQGHDHASLSDLLYRRAGLLGVSGASSDMRVLQASSDPASLRAMEMFCARAAMVGGGLVTAMGGLDAIAFTGGIGEHSAQIRAAIARAFGYLGARLDDAANAAHEAVISAPGSGVAIAIVPANEELVIALAMQALLVGRESAPTEAHEA
ncbi:MAG: Acetate kinase [uncultured Microvirga sp.]|uniref:Acetate kinase n=1 Tax=uncultured Microvirga sp. TaxID=412392 RepID=A0A6J4L097_9HYPH|nr:MAG: Acetate kinase [uncultured Microvirga sp.]